MREALYYEKKDKNVAACLLCPHYCKIQDGKAGICRARQNKGGTFMQLISVGLLLTA
ncbi:MAG: hypothetical protein RQM92_15280 [Candidatus Syntrophopropionicum ammoniitolerans]